MKSADAFIYSCHRYRILSYLSVSLISPERCTAILRRGRDGDSWSGHNGLSNFICELQKGRENKIINRKREEDEEDEEEENEEREEVNEEGEGEGNED